jgi:hypothetical protein
MLTYQSPEYLSCTETAKLIRKALKAAFPTTKFSVQSDKYAGGASIHVSWIDGPSGAQVDEVTKVFSGADFDGMIDLKVYNDHWLEPDGTVTVAKREGTTGSFVEQIFDPPTPNSRLVSLGCDYVLTQRTLSQPVKDGIRDEIEAFVGSPLSGGSIPARVFKYDGGGAALALDDRNGQYLDTAIWQMGALRDYSKPCSCPGDAAYPAGRGVRRCGLCGSVSTSV